MVKRVDLKWSGHKQQQAREVIGALISLIWTLSQRVRLSKHPIVHYKHTILNCQKWKLVWSNLGTVAITSHCHVFHLDFVTECDFANPTKLRVLMKKSGTVISVFYPLTIHIWVPDVSEASRKSCSWIHLLRVPQDSYQSMGSLPGSVSDLFLITRPPWCRIRERFHKVCRVHV